MPVPSNDPQPKRSQWRNAPWLPAGLLIFIQVMTGMRDQPQLAFFLIYLQEHLGLAPVTISSVVAGGQIAGLVTALLGGAIAARLGIKWVLVCGLAISALASVVFQVNPLWLVVLLWLIGGAGMAMVSIGGSSYLTQISERGALGILAAFYALSVTIGGAVGNPAAGAIIERFGFDAYSWVVIAFSAGILLVVIFLMPPSAGHVAKAVSLRSLWSGLSATARQKNVQFLIGLRCMPTIFYGMLTVHIPLLLNSQSGSKMTVATYITTTLIVASGAQLLTGRSADRWGGRIPTLVAYTVMILSGVGLAASAGTVWGLFGFGVSGIAAAWSLSTLMYVWVNDGVPKAEHPATFGLLHAVWSISMITGSVVGSWLVSTSAGLPFLLAGLLNVGSLFLLVAYYNRASIKAGLNSISKTTETRLP